MRSGRGNRSTWQTVFAVATVVTIVLLASHPELRLLVPLIDVMGIDIFIAVVGIQCWAGIKPFVLQVHRHAVMPLAAFLYRALLFFFGYMGPYVDATLTSSRFRDRVAA